MVISSHNNKKRGYNFAKNSQVILKGRTFAVDPDIVSRFFIFAVLFFVATIPLSLNAKERLPYSNSKSLDFSPFEENGKFGLKNNQGQILIPAQYDKLGWSDGSFSIIESVTGYFVNGSWGLINLSNHKVTKATFTDLSPGEGSLIVARKQLPNTVTIRSGIINTSGKVVVPFEYDGLRIHSLRAIVYRKSGFKFLHGLIDFNNKEIIPLKYEIIYPLGSLRYAAVNLESKTGIFSENGAQLTDFSIDSISSFTKNYAVIFQNNLQGVINRSGEIVVKPLYRNINIEDDGTVKTQLANTWTFLQGDNKQSAILQADWVTALGSNLIKLQTGKRTTLADRNLKQITKGEFADLEPFKNGWAISTNALGKKGIIRRDGSSVIANLYEDVRIDKNAIRAKIKTSESQKWIVIDTTGRVVSKKQYDFIDSFNGKFFIVRNKGYFGAINAAGVESIACVHDSILQTKDDYVVIKFKGQYGIINTKEQWIVTPKQSKLELAGNDTYIEHTPGNNFLKSLKGEIIYFTKNTLVPKEKYLAEYLTSGAITKISFTGVVIEKIADDEQIQKVFPEREGLRAIKKDGRYGFIDNRSRLRIANRYEDVKDFSEGLAAAKILGKWGFINKEDKIAIQPVYEEVASFKEGFAVVKQKDLYGLINKAGKVVLPVRYNKIEILSTKRIIIHQNNQVGLANGDGQILINTKFDSIEDVGNDYVIVGRDGKFGVLNIQGVSTIPLMYDALYYDPFHDQFLAMQKAVWVKASL